MENTRIHPTFRDYSAQHLARWTLTALTSGQEAGQVAAAVSALVAALSDETAARETLPGTALMALADLADFDPSLLLPHRIRQTKPR